MGNSKTTASHFVTRRIQRLEIIVVFLRQNEKLREMVRVALQLPFLGGVWNTEELSFFRPPSLAPNHVHAWKSTAIRREGTSKIEKPVQTKRLTAQRLLTRI